MVSKIFNDSLPEEKKRKQNNSCYQFEFNPSFLSVFFLYKKNEKNKIINLELIAHTNAIIFNFWYRNSK